MTNINNKKGSILALDYGLRNIGIAISDETRVISMPLMISSPEMILLDLQNIIQERGIIGIIIGLPKRLDGVSFHKIVDKVVLLGTQIDKKFQLDILFQDERMSTVGANRMINDFMAKNNSKGKNYKKKSRSTKKTLVKDDAHAASFVLQGILDSIQ